MKKLECYTTLEFLQCLQSINKDYPNNGVFRLDGIPVFNNKLKDNLIKLTVEFEEPPKKVTITEKDLESKIEDAIELRGYCKALKQEILNMVFGDKK